MDQSAAIRNFRDFLTIYNKMSEQCFAHCVDDLGQRSLTADELACVDKCFNKNVKLNHRMMDNYMKIQAEKQKQMQQDQEAALQAAQLQQLQSVGEAGPPQEGTAGG